MKKLFYLLSALIISTGILCSCSSKKDNPENEGKKIANADSMSSESDLPEVSAIPKSDSIFIVGMECNNAPFSWIQSNNANSAFPLPDGRFVNGFDVHFAKKVAKGLGRELYIVDTKWDDLPRSLMNGEIDAIISDFSATDERKESLSFSNNYFSSNLVLVVKKSGRFAKAKSISDFSGARITAQINTTHYTAIDQMAGATKDTALFDFPELCAALSSDKIDGFVVEMPCGISAVDMNPDFAMINFSKESGFNMKADELSAAVALAKGSNLVSDINKIVDSFSKEERQFLMEAAIKAQPNKAKE